jgi:hypothetical protein
MPSHLDASWSERARELFGASGTGGDLIGRIVLSIVIQAVLLSLLLAGLVAVPLVLQVFWI